MKILLLPGLDGTGLLFDSLLQYFPESIDYETISLDSLESDSYIGQAAEIAEKITVENVVIVGESYSGRIAFELCKIWKEKVAATVYLASFISRPSFLSYFAKLIPVTATESNMFSKVFLHLVGFNLRGAQDVVNPVFYSLAKANKLKLKKRLANIANLSDPDSVVDCPAIYIRPTTDFLVSFHAVKILLAAHASAYEVKLVGGHFIAQSSPAECAAIICNVAKTIVNNSGVVPK